MLGTITDFYYLAKYKFLENKNTQQSRVTQSLHAAIGH